MDQTTFTRMITDMAQEYYATPRSTEVPTPDGPKDLATIEHGGRLDTWVLEDFGAWLKQRDDRTQREVLDILERKANTLQQADERTEKAAAKLKALEQADVLPFRTGQRVRVKQRVEAYPNFIVEQGAQGVVTEVEPRAGGEVKVLMDEHLPGCQEWGNVVFFNEDMFPPVDYLEVIP